MINGADNGNGNGNGNGADDDGGEGRARNAIGRFIRRAPPDDRWRAHLSPGGAPLLSFALLGRADMAAAAAAVAAGAMVARDSVAVGAAERLVCFCQPESGARN